MAGEDKDDEEDDEDEDDEDEDEDDDFGGGDSNNANEEENEKVKKFGGPKNNHGTVAADGSIKFGGPQNERQRAVVAAFQHAWQVLNSTWQTKASLLFLNLEGHHMCLCVITCKYIKVVNQMLTACCRDLGGENMFSMK